MRRHLFRILREDGGFTLVEMLVTMMVMLLVMFALYSIFDMSIRVFSFGSDKIEAVENARLGLEKMEREVRAAYPYDISDVSTGNDHLFFSTGNPGTGAIPSAARITFGNDLNGNGRIDCSGSAGRCEYITYKLASSADSAGACSEATAPCTLRRVNARDSASSGQPVVESVQPGGLTFAFFESDGTAPESESEVTRVQLRLQIDVDGSSQSLTTDVALRNRAGP